MDAPGSPPPVPLGRRLDQLEALIGALAELAALLEEVPGGRWAAHFASCLDRARELRRRGFSQEDLSAFSGGVLCVYGGAGSFSDFVPAVPGPDPGTWVPSPVNGRLEELRERVGRLALDLRVVGER